MEGMGLASERREAPVEKGYRSLTVESALSTVVGMALFWQVLRFRNVTALFPEQSPALFAFVCALAVGALACAAAPQRMRRLVADGRFVMGCAGGASAALALQGIALAAGWWSAASPAPCLLGFGAGLGNAVVLIAWYTRLAATGTPSDGTTMILLFGSAALSFFMGIVMFSLSPAPELFTVMVPVLAGACYRLGAGGPEADEGPDESAPGPVALPDEVLARLSNFGAPPSGTLLVLLVVSGLLGNMVLVGAPRTVLPEYTLWLKYLLSIAVVAAAFGALYRAANERKTAFAIGLCLAVALAAGMAMLGAGVPVVVATGVAVVTSCRTGGEVLVVFLLVRDSFDCRAAYRNFAVLFLAPVVVAFSLGCWLVPALCAAAGTTAPTALPVLAVALSLAVVLALVAVLGVLVVRSFDLEGTPDWNEGVEDASGSEKAAGASGAEKEAAPRAAAPQVAGPATAPGAPPMARRPEEDGAIPDDTLRRIAAERGLTARETQILVYAFRGYALAHIAALDVVSINTVKSHWKNLYRKLDVHTRQELIDFVEARLDAGAPTVP